MSPRIAIARQKPRFLLAYAQKNGSRNAPQFQVTLSISGGTVVFIPDVFTTADSPL